MRGGDKFRRGKEVRRKREKNTENRSEQSIESGRKRETNAENWFVCLPRVSKLLKAEYKLDE